jgi:hypothetical protein
MMLIVLYLLGLSSKSLAAMVLAEVPRPGSAHNDKTSKHPNSQGVYIDFFAMTLFF